MQSFVNLHRFDIPVATYADTIWACQVVHAFLDCGERRVFFAIIKLAVKKDKGFVALARLSGKNGTVPAFRNVENHAVGDTVNNTVVPFEILVHTALPHASWQLILVRGVVFPHAATRNFLERVKVESGLFNQFVEVSVFPLHYPDIHVAAFWALLSVYSSHHVHNSVSFTWRFPDWIGFYMFLHTILRNRPSV